MDVKKKAFFFNSLKYIFVSGASKGFNYILLLYLGLGDFSKQYVTILLLLSLEQILSLILPLNNPNIIYSKSILKYDEITNKLITNSILTVALYVLIFILFKQSIYSYFEFDNVLVFMSIFISMLINSYMVYLTNYYKLIEKHQTALLIQALLFISFLSIVITLFFVENKVIAFFLGKTIGLIIILFIVKFLRLNIAKFKFGMLNFNELKNIFNLLSVSILGWVSGLGFMNIAKIYSTSEELVRIGYILNLCNVFLLVSIGVNSVYNPLIKKHLIKGEIKKTLKIKNTTLLIYLSIAILCFVGYFIIDKTHILNGNQRVYDMFNVIPYTILIFMFSVFQSVAHPFYLINDKFKSFNLINIFSYIFWILLIITCSYFGYKNYVWFLVIIYFIKASWAYLYAKMTFMNENYKLDIK